MFLFFFSFILFSLFITERPTNGDTYVYASAISTFRGPLIHFGYYVIGFIFHSFLQKVGSNSMLSLGYVSVFFGSISVVCMYLFTLELTKNRFQSLLSSLILLFSGAFWFFSTHGEVYVPQLGFVLLSVLCAVRRKRYFPVFSFLFQFPLLRHHVWLFLH